MKKESDHHQTIICLSAFVALLLLVFLGCAGIIKHDQHQTTQQIETVHDYNSAATIAEMVVFDRHEDGNVDWTSCAMSVRGTVYSKEEYGDLYARLPDGNYWLLGNDPTLIRDLISKSLLAKPEYAKHYKAPHLLLMEAVPYGTCRWSCDLEKESERCFVELPL